VQTSWNNDPTVRVADGPAAPSSPAATPHQLTNALLIDVLAGICGTLLGSAFDDSATTRLIGMVLGTVVASLFTVAGPFRHLRVAAAVGITALSLVLTYSGAKAVEPLGGPGTEIFPALQGNNESPGSSQPPTPTATVTCEGSRCIQVTPSELTCTTESCGPVTVANPGSRVLKIGKVEITGPAADTFGREGDCAGISLAPGRQCTIRLAYTGIAGGEATLVIHQNLDGPPSKVALVGRHTTASPDIPPEPRPDLKLSAAHLQCSVVRGGALSGADNLTVWLSVLGAGSVPVHRLVPFRLSSDTGLSGGGNTAISSGAALTAMQVDLGPDDYGVTHRFDVIVDPSDEIAEENEQNNRLRIAVTMGSRPAKQADRTCRLLK
jgi:hypothetical protein